MSVVARCSLAHSLNGSGYERMNECEQLLSLSLLFVGMAWPVTTGNVNFGTKAKLNT